MAVDGYTSVYSPTEKWVARRNVRMSVGGFG